MGKKRHFILWVMETETVGILWFQKTRTSPTTVGRWESQEFSFKEWRRQEGQTAQRQCLRLIHCHLQLGRSRLESHFFTLPFQLISLVSVRSRFLRKGYHCQISALNQTPHIWVPCVLLSLFWSGATSSPYNPEETSFKVCRAFISVPHSTQRSFYLILW